MEIYPREPITANNYGPVVNVVAWVALVAIILVASLKTLLAKLSVGLGWDDGLIMGAVVCYIAYTASVSVQVSNGVGRHMSALSEHQLRGYQVTGYVSQLFFIFTLVCTKMSTIAFTLAVSPRKYDRLASIAIAIFIACWCLSSLFAVAFQCSLPDPWRILMGTCIDQEAFWLTFAAFNILTELALVALPSAIVLQSRIPLRTKFFMVSGFNARILVIGAIGVQIYFIHRAGFGGNDRTFDAWPAILCQTVVLVTAVITLCIPYIKGVMIGMESGMIQTGHFHHQHHRRTPESVLSSILRRKKDRSKRSGTSLSMEPVTLASISEHGEGHERSSW